ncbi:fimbrial protein [Pseudomonas sp. R2.Fl]|nr:fimbrial protein [Pseudomonas sp. R2.Fl]
MRTLIRLLALGALLVMSQKSFALTCLKDASENIATITMGASIAVPTSLPKDTVLWRSPDYQVEISCWANQFWNAKEAIFFYLSPEDPSLISIGPDLEIGMSVQEVDKGQDKRCSQLGKQNGYCAIKLPYMTEPCMSNSGCPHKKTTFTLNYNFFISKRSPPGPAKEGVISGHSSYAIFQLDGAGGPIADNFRMILNGLNQLRFVKCSSTLSLSHPTLDFGGMNKASAQRDQIAGEKPFSITTHKDCDSAFGLGAILKPIANTDLDASHEHMLVPKDNKSIGITLHDPDNSMILIPVNKEFELVKHGTDRTVVRNFLARATWLKDLPQVQLGKFNAGATIDIYYK